MIEVTYLYDSAGKIVRSSSLFVNLKNATEKVRKMTDKKLEQARSAIALGRMQELLFALETLSKKCGLENPAQLEIAVNEVYKYYETIMDDLLFEARLESNDPANGYSVDTEWLSKVLKDVQVGMRDY
tara:strand:- start:115 stop:498 length:384 start_codon:yes stop_codon:yes gene_type:complete